METNVTEFDIYTFEEAQKRFENMAERYGHLRPVVLTYFKGGFRLNYTKDELNEDSYRQVCDCD